MFVTFFVIFDSLSCLLSGTERLASCSREDEWKNPLNIIILLSDDRPHSHRRYEIYLNNHILILKTLLKTFQCQNLLILFKIKKIHFPFFEPQIIYYRFAKVNISDLRRIGTRNEAGQLGVLSYNVHLCIYFSSPWRDHIRDLMWSLRSNIKSEYGNMMVMSGRGFSNLNQSFKYYKVIQLLIINYL